MGLAMAADFDLPRDFREWQSFDRGARQKLYVNPAAAEGLRSGSFADGATLIFDATDHPDATKRRVDWMTKDAGKFSATGGWAYLRHVRGRLVVEPASAEAKKCWTCHAGPKATGGVFTTQVKKAAWNAALAASYLDMRAKKWAEWPVARAAGGSCLSCHTGLTYLLARPALRRAANETTPTPMETALLDGLRTRLQSTAPGREPRASVESVLAAIVLPEAKAQERMWAKRKGDTWPWYALKLHPWESEHSAYWGAAMAALAAGYAAPAEPMAALLAYLKRELPVQPIHNRLATLWASSKAKALLPEPEAKALRESIWALQSAEGAWTMESLGPWTDREDKPASTGANTYATAYSLYALQAGGANCNEPRMRRGLEWLASKQNPKTGAWAAPSMNKTYPAGSMQEAFMVDAATGYAVLALLGEACRNN